MTSIDHNPFTPFQKLELYSLMSLHQLIVKLQWNIIRLLLTHYPDQKVSSLTLLSIDEQTVDTLLDTRDSTFKINYYLDEMYSNDNDAVEYV
jgi:hypothetical protein